ncbi:MAG TPA: TIGR00730 family Rossman fold protein [Candidatus Saccharimonadales bacterium]
MKPKPEETDQPICIPRDIVLQAAMMRLGNIDDEVQDGYNIIRKYHKTVTIFGSARTPIDNPDYQKAREVAARLAQANYTVITGGGHGIMAAANQGAKEAGGNSLGFNIALPHEQTLNPYTTESYAFKHFAPRKIVMTLYADAYIYFPGGFGTFDELTEILTLIQTGKTNKAPIILVGTKFWEAFDQLARNALLDSKSISADDLNLYTITDSTEEVIQIVKSNKTYCDDE